MNISSVMRKEALNKLLRIADECRNCGGNDYEIRSRVTANGAKQYAPQCLTCGRSMGNPLKQSEYIGCPPEWDYDLQEQWDSQRRIEHEEKANEWWDRYKAYLKTSEWKHRRRLVMLRSQGICEGCRERPAKEVHHLTYAHVCEEFLFELVALCEECHDRIHGHDDE